MRQAGVTMFLKDFDNQTTCPLKTDESGAWPCSRDKCALWHKSTNPQFSCCGLYSIVHNLNTISYELSRGVGE